MMVRKAVVDAKTFSSALDQVSKVLRKSSIPVLAEALVSISDGQCTLTATDIETYLFQTVPARGDELSFVFRKTKDVAKACRLFLQKAPRSSRSIRSICCLWATVCIKKRGFCSPSAISKSFRRSAWSPAQPTPSPRTRFTAGFYPKASGRAFCAHTPKKATAERCMAAKVQANCSST